MPSSASLNCWQRPFTIYLSTVATDLDVPLTVTTASVVLMRPSAVTTLHYQAQHDPQFKHHQNNSCGQYNILHVDSTLAYTPLLQNTTALFIAQHVSCVEQSLELLMWCGLICPSVCYLSPLAINRAASPWNGLLLVVIPLAIQWQVALQH